MFIGHSHTGVIKTEIIILLVFVIAFDPDFRAFTGIADAVFHQVSEDGINQGVISVDGRMRWDFILHLHLRFRELPPQFLHDVGNHAVDVYFFSRHGFRSFFGFRNQSNVTNQIRQTDHLRVGTLQKIMLFLGRERPTGENRLNVSAYAANGGAKFVRDVIAHLLLEEFVFLASRHVCQRHLKTPVVVDQQLDHEVISAGSDCETKNGGLFHCGTLATGYFKKLHSGGKGTLMP